MRKSFYYIIVLLTVSCMLSVSVRRKDMPFEKLSEYGFFNGNLSDQQPSSTVIPYQLSTPLFSDYAEKLRFVQIPDGSSVIYNDSIVFDFPTGTTLIKTFYYPLDFRTPSKGRKLLETRLLIKKEKGWIALPYIWKDDQSDAMLDVAGETKMVSYTDAGGKKQKHSYLIPNQNQCKGCHNKNEILLPIGPSARQLNHEITYVEGNYNQLAYWEKKGKLGGLPGTDERPKTVFWNDPATATLDERARAWLDINCGHCHRPDGPAGTSGMYLNYGEKNPLRIGIAKTPVAAGRGSGNLNFGIVPGHPEQSILVYRMESDDPGVMMPELGRTLKHKEGITLVKEWISKMKSNK